MIIQVTSEHIRNGCVMRASNCPVALAIQPHFPGKLVTVTLYWVQIYDSPKDSLSDRYKLNQEVHEWIIKFDSELPVEPFEFELGEIITRNHAWT